MNTLIEKSQRRINQCNFFFQRYLMHHINWKHRLISITGSRGVGKTTLVLQYMKSLDFANDEMLYISLDDIYFSKSKLVDVADDFLKLGGKLLVIDEVHKYPDWSREIKNIYDNFNELQIIFTGSSILEINKGEGDLSRRAVNYNLPVMSFREFILLNTKKEFKVLTLNEIISDHVEIAGKINKTIKPLMLFKKYIQYGAYPFYLEAGIEFSNQLMKTIQILLESDFISVLDIDYSHILKLKKLLLLIAESVPFKPNISELSSKVGITRDTVIKYFNYLQKANLIYLLNSENKGFKRFEKPEKIYLNNCNQLFAISSTVPNNGTIRETFFLQHVKQVLHMNYSKYGDFLVDGKYIYEIGGKTKNFNQIKNLPNSFLALDEIEYGSINKIPLWLVGFIY